MKITYISHAALLIETDGIKILTDPWISGSAYCGQWYLFPKPEADYTKYLRDVDYILISHGHEDHLHYDTLKEINKNAHIFFPYTWYEGAVGFFNELGFENITEAINEHSYKLSKNVKITYLANNLDNVVVIENGNETIVNVNDALPSAPLSIISYFTGKIKRKWKQVDYLFSSYGGASYFPNTIKFKNKNDIDIGIIREQFFLDNFCKIAKDINATYSIPFASDFVLLDDDQRWINEVKFPKNEIKNYFSKYYGGSGNTQITALYPGDVISDGKFFLNSVYHEKFKNNDRNELIEQEYRDEIIKKRNIKNISKAELIEIFEKIKFHVNRKAYIVPAEKRKELKFAIKITDAVDDLFIQVDLTGTENKTELVSELSADNILLLKIKSNTILYSINNEWGGDAIIIGYGCELIIFSEETIIKQLENVAVQLLTNYPNTKEYIKKNPIRTINYLANDKIKRKIFLNKLLGQSAASPFLDERLADSRLWLTRTNCEICRKCNLPILTSDLAGKIL